MKKRKPKLPSWAGAVRSPLGASKADAAQRLAAEDIAVERTKRRHTLLRKLDELRGLDEAEKRMGERGIEEPATPFYDARDLDAAGWTTSQPAKPLAHPVRERMDVPTILTRDGETYARKAADYAPGPDQFENFTFSANFAARVCRGLPDGDQKYATATLIGVKVSRLMTLGLVREGANECIKDTLMDLRVYLAILEAQLVPEPPF
jgi:hypothetical protein